MISYAVFYVASKAKYQKLKLDYTTSPSFLALLGKFQELVVSAYNLPHCRMAFDLSQNELRHT